MLTFVFISAPPAEDSAVAEVTDKVADLKVEDKEETKTEETAEEKETTEESEKTTEEEKKAEE